MAETTKPEVDLTNLFIKGKPFANLVIASILMGMAICLAGFPGGILGIFITGSIAAAVTFVALGISHMFKNEQGKTRVQEQKDTRVQEQGNSPQIEQNINTAQEPERKSGMELMERGNKAVSGITR